MFTLYSGERLETDEKTEYINQARRPVEIMYEQLTAEKNELVLLEGIRESKRKQIEETAEVEEEQLMLEVNELVLVDGKCESKRKKIEETKRSIEIARQNAASDIYERLNSRGDMGIYNSLLPDHVETQVDLHGLQVKEAKWIIDERILPVLPVYSKMILITGRGLHSRNGQPVLKQAVQSYLVEKNVKVEEVSHNTGCLRICYAE